MGTAKYSEEFKAQAVALVVEKGRNPSQVARELGVTGRSVRDWVQQHMDSQKDEYVRIHELERENRQLRKELAESQETVDILKKTAAILSKR